MLYLMKPLNVVYYLYDPRDGEPRYVGVTDSAERRLDQHTFRQNHTVKGRWLYSLLVSGVRPTMIVLDFAADSEWAAKELYWVKYFRSLGFDILNGEPGGPYYRAPRPRGPAKTPGRVAARKAFAREVEEASARLSGEK